MSLSMYLAFIRRQFFSTIPEPSVSFKGKTVIVTGGNTGLGLEAARWTIKLGASRVILGCRNLEKGRVAAKSIQESTGCRDSVIDVWQIDMNSYESVVDFAERTKSELTRVDALFANAGIAYSVFRMAEEDEETITVNVVSTFLLATLLHPKLRETAARHGTQTHITFTGSEMYETAEFKERIGAPPGKLFATLSSEKKAVMGNRYDVSKLLVEFGLREMATASPVKQSNVILNSVGPGLCRTGLGSRDNTGFMVNLIMRLLAIPAEVGARKLVFAASAGADTHGRFLLNNKVTEMGGLVAGKPGAELQRKVWEELLGKLEVIRPGCTSF